MVKGFEWYGSNDDSGGMRGAGRVVRCGARDAASPERGIVGGGRAFRTQSVAGTATTWPGRSDFRAFEIFLQAATGLSVGWLGHGPERPRSCGPQSVAGAASPGRSLAG